jgi:hypothetical protein
VEHCFAAFARFSRLQGPFQSKAAAEQHLALLLLGDVFSVRLAEAIDEHQGRCPRQQAGYRVGQVPRFHLLKRPPLGLFRDRIAQRFAEAA